MGRTAALWSVPRAWPAVRPLPLQITAFHMQREDQRATAAKSLADRMAILEQVGAAVWQGGGGVAGSVPSMGGLWRGWGWRGVQMGSGAVSRPWLGGGVIQGGGGGGIS